MKKLDFQEFMDLTRFFCITQETIYRDTAIELPTSIISYAPKPNRWTYF